MRFYAPVTTAQSEYLLSPVVFRQYISLREICAVSYVQLNDQSLACKANEPDQE